MRLNLTGNTRSSNIEVDGRSKKQTYLEIKPTLLQALLMHYRRHPNDKSARHALRLYSDEEIDNFLAVLPETLWISEKEYQRREKEWIE